MKASIIIPSYNAQERLYLNLTALNLQRYDSDDVEVIVIDNGSTDNTTEMLQDFKLKFPMKIIRIEKNIGIANGRNKGVINAEGRILIFHDSDMLAGRDYITQHLDAHKEANVVACGLFWRRIFTYYYKRFSPEQKANFEIVRESMGVKPLSLYWEAYPLMTEDYIKENDIWPYSFDLDYSFIADLKTIVSQFGKRFNDYFLPWRFCLTNNLSVERQKVLDVGMFDKNIVRYGYEDYDLGIRLYKAGCKFVMADHIVSIHQEHPANYKSDDILINVNYMCDKYNNIYFIDVPLVCMSDSLGINRYDLNQLTKEINSLIRDSQYHEVLELFLATLQVLRKRFFSPAEENCDGVFINIVKKLNNNTHEIALIEKQEEASCFMRHLKILLKQAFNISLGELLTQNSNRGDNNYE